MNLHNASTATDTWHSRNRNFNEAKDLRKHAEFMPFAKEAAELLDFRKRTIEEQDRTILELHEKLNQPSDEIKTLIGAIQGLAPSQQRQFPKKYWSQNTLNYYN